MRKRLLPSALKPCVGSAHLISHCSKWVWRFCQKSPHHTWKDKVWQSRHFVSSSHCWPEAKIQGYAEMEPSIDSLNTPSSWKVWHLHDPVQSWYLNQSQEIPPWVDIVRHKPTVGINMCPVCVSCDHLYWDHFPLKWMQIHTLITMTKSSFESVILYTYYINVCVPAYWITVYEQVNLTFR